MERATKVRRLSTLRGRPSTLVLRGLFLFDPESIMKLDGEPLRAQYVEAGYESMHRGLERAVGLGLKNIPPRLGKQMLNAIAGAPSDPLLESLRKAIAGDQQAAAAVQQLGIWETYRAAFKSQRSELGLQMTDYFVRIERESASVERLISQKRFREAAELIADAPLLRQFATQVSLDRLAVVESPTDLVWFQLPGALAVLISQLALLEHLLEAKGQEHAVRGHLLTPDQGAPNPGREFMRWFKTVLGAKSVDDLLDLQVGMDKPYDETTWKRWHSGAIFPSENQLRRFVDHVLRADSEKDLEAVSLTIGTQHWAARRLHHVVAMLAHMERTSEQTTAALLGQLSTSEWLTCTYSRWREHWAAEGWT